MIPWFDKTSFSIGPLTIHLFGILVATGIVVGSRLTHRRAKALGLAEDRVASMITSVVVFGFLFAHVFDVFAYQTKGPNPSLLEILNPFEGISSYGGFIGAVAALFIWCRKNHQPVMPYADSLAFGLAAGWMFGRLGCFSAHDHPGHQTTFFLAVQYPDGPRHDLGLYEAIWSAMMTGLFLYLEKRGKQPLGLYVTLLCGAYAPVRFGLDFLRATDTLGADPRYFGLTPAQYGCIAVVGITVFLARYTWKQARTAEAA